MKKVLIILGIIIPIIVVFVAAASSRSIEPMETAEQPPVEQAMAVEGVEIGLGKLIGSVQVSGVVEGVAETFVIAETGGTVSALNVSLGDFVREGEALVVLADRGEGSTLEQIEAQLENAQREFSATEKLFSRGSASEAELTRVKSVLRGIEASYTRAIDALDARVLTSPISGYVADLDPSATAGNVMNPGTRVARIVDLSSLKMRASLGERQMALVDRGAQVKIMYSALDIPNDDARITAVAAGADPSTGAYRVVMKWPNTTNLTRSGLTATAVIMTNEPDELIIPASAIITRNGTSGVFVYDDGTAVFSRVSAGKRFGDMMTVESGVEAGDVILVSGTTTLNDGDPIVVSLLGSVGEGK